MKYVISILFLCAFTVPKKSVRVVAKYSNGEFINYNYFDDSGKLVKICMPPDCDTLFFYYKNMVLDSPYTSKPDENSLRTNADFVNKLEILSERNIIAPYAGLYLDEVLEIGTMVTLTTGKRIEERKGARRIISVNNIHKRIAVDPSTLTSNFPPDYILRSYRLELRRDTITKETYFLNDGSKVIREYTYKNSFPCKIQIKLKYKEDRKIYNSDSTEYKILK